MSEEDKSLEQYATSPLNRREVLKTGVLAGAGAVGLVLADVSSNGALAAMAASKAGVSQLSGDPWVHIPSPEQVAVTEGYAETPGVKLWYWDTGGEGEVIVLCHPGSHSSLIWEYQQPVFAQAGYRVIAYSRRGHYKTEKGPEDNPGSQVEDLIHLLDFLNVKKAHVLGAAAGGMAAMAFAVAHPERLHSLVLAGSIVGPNEQEWRDMFGRLELRKAREHMSPEFLELGPSYRAGNPEGFARFVELEELAKPNGPFSQPSGVDVTWAVMEAMQVPTLLLTGEADMYAPPSLQRLFAKHLPNYEMVFVSEAGHAAYWERPDVFNEIVLEFAGRNAN